MDARLVIPAIFLITMAYLILPVAVFSLIDGRRARRVTCPETGKEERVHLDATRLAVVTFLGGRPCVDACTRWPAREGCDRACERQLMGAQAA